MDFENLFAELEKITETKSKKIVCCNNIENHKNTNGVIECSQCSKIISNILSTPEWRYYGADDTKSGDPTRCGMPMNLLLPDSSVGSIVLNQYSKDKNMNQIKKYQEWSSMTYKERSTYKVYNIITDICKKYDFPKVIEIEGKSLYKIISETKISRGNNRKGIIASCIYFACKTCNVPRSQKEIAQIFNLKIPVMTKGCKLFQEIIHMSKNKTRVLNADSITSEDFIERFCNRLNIDESHISFNQLVNKETIQHFLYRDFPDQLTEKPKQVTIKKKLDPELEKRMYGTWSVEEIVESMKRSYPDIWKN